MTSLGLKIGVSLLGRSVNVIAKTKSNTNIRNLGSDTTSSVENGSTGSSSKRSLFKGGLDVSDNTLKNHKVSMKCRIDECDC